MPWFAVDDNADMDPKLVKAGNPAVGLWLRCGAYAARHLTDGMIPGEVARLYGTATQIKKLVVVGLWHEHGHACDDPKCQQPQPGDYYMHGYLNGANKPRAEVEARRRKDAEKKQNWRARQSGSDDRPPPPPKRPQRPAPAGPPAGPIPEDWQPTQEDIAAAQMARADAGWPQLTEQQLAAVTRKFVRRQLEEKRTAPAWGSRWQTWAERERADDPPPPQPGGNVVPLRNLTRSQQQRAGLDRLRDRLNGGNLS